MVLNGEYGVLACTGIIQIERRNKKGEKPFTKFGATDGVFWLSLAAGRWKRLPREQSLPQKMAKGLLFRGSDGAV